MQEIANVCRIMQATAERTETLSQIADGVIREASEIAYQFAGLRVQR
jgi:hypothetical protein